MEIKEIIDDDLILARFIPASIAWGKDLNFFSRDAEYQQVGTWCYQAGKQLSRHKHNFVERKVTRTQEVLYIKKGRIKSFIYDKNGVEKGIWIAQEGDIIILLEGGHGYEIIEDETQVLEIKNGPYLGADIDRNRF